VTTYQIYDFIKDINFHINKKNPIDLTTKSEAFKTYLFKLKIFTLSDKIKRSHPIFNEDYFIFVLYNVVYVAKKIENEPLKFDYVEVLSCLKVIRKMKLKKLFE
jgi:hypothetical protein